jgi:hemerythrin-like domain-containing protein
MSREQAQTVANRRELLRLAAVAGVAVAGCATTGSSQASQVAKGKDEHEEAEVTPGEDLMQEHGVIERILLIYDEGARRIEQKERADLSTIASAAGIVRRFVQDYHEKSEEDVVFPRLQSAHREADLVAVLLQQHQRGRQLTDEIARLSGLPPSGELAKALRAFSRMYRPHAAREDTVLFPAFREVVGRAAYHELGEQFEDKEHQLFGEHGFEQIVAQVAGLERSFGIFDLASFTPA